MTPFLIRTAKNEIFGPRTREEVGARIRSRQIGIQDEVCAGDGYWIHLSESEELKAQLQITNPEDFPGELRDSDATETDTLTATATATLTAPSLSTEAVATSSSGFQDEHTGVFQVRPPQQPFMARARIQLQQGAPLSRGYSVGEKDPMRLWKWIILFIVFLLAAILFRILILLP